jgi:hypothetical protein
VIETCDDGWCLADRLTPPRPMLRLYQLHLTDSDLPAPTIDCGISAFRFFFFVSVDPSIDWRIGPTSTPRLITSHLNALVSHRLE